MTADPPLDAGALAPWLDGIGAVLRGERSADVDCTGCTACCASSQFVHVEPDEADALAAVPVALHFPAPGGPRGHVVVPYDETGRCPLLGADGCTVYAARPRTCRTYDCRVFTAAGIEPRAESQVAIAARTARWRFDERSAEDHRARRALAAARAEVSARPDVGEVPPLACALAVVRLAAARFHEGH